MLLISRKILSIAVIFFLMVLQINGQEESLFKGPAGETYLGLGSLLRTQYDPVSNSLVTGGSFGLFGWDLQTGKMKSETINYDKPCRDFIISPDGKFIIKLYGEYVEKEIRDSSHTISIVRSTVVSGYQISGLSQDGKLLLTQDANANLRIWNTETMDEAVTLEENVNNLNFAVISPKAGYLLTSSYDYLTDTPKAPVKLWSLKTGKRIAELAIKGDYTPADIRGAVFSPDDQYVVTYGYSSKTQMWSTETGNAFSAPALQSDQVLFLKDNSYLVLHNDKINLYQVGEATALKTIKPDKEYYFYQMLDGSNADAILFISNKNSSSASGSKVSIWDSTIRSLVDTIALQESLSPLFAVPDQKYLVCKQSGSVIKVADMETGKTLNTIEGFIQSSYMSMSSGNYSPFTGDTKQFFQINYDGMVYFYKANSNTLLRSVLISNYYPSPSVSADGSVIACFDSDTKNKYINLINTITKKKVSAIKITPYITPLRSIYLSPDASSMLLIFTDKMELWDVSAAVKIREVQPFDNSYTFRSLLFSSDGKNLLLPTDSGYQMQDIKTGKISQTYSFSQYAGLLGIDISNDGSMLALSSATEIVVFDYQTGKKIKSLDGFKTTPCETTDYPFYVRFSPDHRFILLATSSKSKLMDYETGKVVKEFYKYPTSLQNVVFSEDGNQIVFSFNDGNRSVWDIYAITHPIREISYQEQTAYAGSPLSIPINIDCAENVIGALFTIKYDANKLLFKQAKAGSLSQNTQPVFFVKDGILKVALSTEKPLAGKGVLCELEFEVLAGNSSATAPSFEIKEVQLNDGQILVNSKNAMITVLGKRFRWGDVNGDDKDGVLDASLLMQWLAGKITQFPLEPSFQAPQFPQCADLNGDNKLDSKDAMLILHKKVELLSRYPVDTNNPMDFGPEAKRRFDSPAINNEPKGTDRIISIPKTTIIPENDIVTIPVSINAADGLLGYYLDIQFDSKKLEYIGIDKGGLTQTWVLPAVNAAGDSLKIAAAGIDELRGAGSVAVIQWKIRPVYYSSAAVDLQIIFNEAELNDGAIGASTQNGKISLSTAACDWFLY